MKDMLMLMIRNAYNDKNIEELKTIHNFIRLIPMKYFMQGDLTRSDAFNLQDLIETNIKMLGGE